MQGSTLNTKTIPTKDGDEEGKTSITTTIQHYSAKNLANTTEEKEMKGVMWKKHYFELKNLVNKYKKRIPLITK